MPFPSIVESPVVTAGDEFKVEIGDDWTWSFSGSGIGDGAIGVELPDRASCSRRLATALSLGPSMDLSTAWERTEGIFHLLVVMHNS